MSTPFAQLDQTPDQLLRGNPYLIKSAAPVSGPTDWDIMQANKAQAQQAPPPQSTGRALLGAAGEIGTDVLLGSNPFTGVPYYGTKAFSDFKNGNIWSGLGNIGWGALSFLPGASLAKGVGKSVVKTVGHYGGKALAKNVAQPLVNFAGGAARAVRPATNLIRPLQTGHRLAPATSKTLMTAGLGVGMGSSVADLATGQSAGNALEASYTQTPETGGSAMPGAIGAAGHIQAATGDIRRMNLSLTQ